MDRLAQDFRFALRMLRVRPGFTVAALLSLALGIGANATIFSLVDALLLRPLPLHDVDRLVAISTVDAKNPGQAPLSHLNWKDLRAQNRTLAGMVGYDWTSMSVATTGDPEVLVGQMVPADYFKLLQVPAERGRTFLPSEDDAPGAHPVAVLSDRFWHQRMAADPGAVGSTIRINGTPFTVVGVAPPWFQGPFVGVQPELWVPMAMNAVLRSNPDLNWYETRRGLFVFGIARLKPGVTVDQARADLKAIMARLEHDFPDDNKGRSVEVTPVAQATLGGGRQGVVSSSILLLGIVGIVLLIACANVANLLLARASARRREIAIRLSQGAARGRLVRQLMTESLVLALLGGGLGLLLAFWAQRGLVALLPRLPFPVTPALGLSVDFRVLLFTLGIALLTGLLFGLAPALASVKPELLTALKDSPSAQGRSGRKIGVRGVLVAAQVALSLVALIAAGLFLRSLGAASRIDPGYDPDRLLAVSFDVGFAGLDPARGRLAIRSLEELVAALPGVEAVSVAQAGPMQGSFARSVFLEGKENEKNGTLVQVNGVEPSYFATIGIPLRGGRAFTAADREGGAPVAIVNETMAKTFWPGVSAVGQRFKFFGDTTPNEIVGVAKDAKYNGLGEDPQPYVYVPHEQRYASGVTLIARTARDPLELVSTVEREIRAYDRNLPITLARPVRDVLSDSLWAPQAGALLLALFGGLALILAAVGLYGVMSFAVAQRQREIGIRMALGAGSPSVLRLILGQALWIVAIGLALGLVLGFGVGHLAQSLLFGVPATDPVALLGTSALLALVAFLASFIPARRAAGVDPNSVLRTE
jgi:predicted permease